jgi:4-amino-4-deoxy-L-arabinose transferase-like glycosyltransferase
MAQGGSWLIPENNGIPRLVKPPLLYWEMATAMRVFGVNAFAARLPGALAIVASVLVTAAMGTRLLGSRGDWLAGAILLTFLGMFSLGRIVMPEQTLSAAVAGAVWCVWRGTETSRRGWWIGFWACAAVASFVKGPHGALYPLAIAGLAAVFCPEARRPLRGLVSPWGIGIFLLVNVPWMVVVEARFPGWLHNLVFTEHAGHLTGSSAPATDYTSVPRWQFLVLHLAWFFPWSIAAGITALRHVPDWRWSRPGHPVVLLVVWAVVFFGSVLLTGQRQDYYAMAMWPTVALGAAAVVTKWTIRPGAAVVAGLLVAGLAASFFLGGSAPPGTDPVAARATAWTTLLGFDPTVWASLQVTAWWAMGGGVVFALWAAVRNSNVAMVACAACLALGAASGTAVVAPYFSLATLDPSIPSGAPVHYDGGIDTGSSLLFYTESPVIVVGQDPGEEFIVRKFGIGRERFASADDVQRLWAGPETVFLITDRAKLETWRAILGTLPPPRATSGTEVLISNR